MARYARDTNARTLFDVLDGCDLFMGLSAPRVLKPEWLKLLAPRPIIMALANPEPEILPEAVAAARLDAVVATGRSDYPNQVNNVLCFPFIFPRRAGRRRHHHQRGDEARRRRGDRGPRPASRRARWWLPPMAGRRRLFGPDYIIPKPFDPRLILEIAPAVARAAMATGVATRPITDFAAYHDELEVFVFRSGQVMRPVIEAARRSAARIVYSEGEDERVLRAVQTLVDDGIAEPILLGRRAVIEQRIRAMGLRMDLDNTVQVLDPMQDGAVFNPLVADYRLLVGRRGIPAEGAERQLHGRNSVAAAMLLHSGQVDAAIVGGVGDWWRTLRYVLPVITRQESVTRLYALSCLILQTGILFVADTHMNVDPTAEQIVEMTLLAASAVREFGLVPKAALLSHSNFGSSNTPSARKMRVALGMLRKAAPELEIDGEMHSDAALSEAIRDKAVPDSKLTGSANLLIMPTLDAANIAFNLLKAAAEGLPIGPMLLGLSKPIQVLIPSVTARGIVNISALAAQAVHGAGGALSVVS